MQPRPPPRPLITLTTDFGTKDSYVSVMKAVLLRHCPEARLIDVTHDLPRHDILCGSITLERAIDGFPPGTVHLAVVDPGVGTERRALALSSVDGALLVGPDNGLLVPAAESLGGIVSAVSLTNPDYHLQPVSSTFHGRDIFASVAAHLAAGLDPARLGEVVDPASLVRVEPFGAEKDGANALVATIISVDRYGNARLSVTEEEAGLKFGMLLKVEAGEGGDLLVRYVEAFGHSKVGDLVLVPDSHRCLSLSVNQGNASRALGLEAGARVRLALLENGPKHEVRRDAGS
jgi:S-adenosyl-L-methionine hydrolase (adenosine-forming)